MQINKYAATVFSLLLFISLSGCAARAPVRGIADRSLLKKTSSYSTLSDIRNRTEASRGWLGVSVQDVTAEVAKNLNLKPPTGAFIVGVSEGGPAAKAGLRSGDVITAVNGRTIKNYSTLSMIVANFRVGENVTIKAFRNGQERIYSVTIERRNENEIETAARDSRSGIMAQELAQGKEAPLNRSAKDDRAKNISRLSVFNFNAVNIDASKYGPEVTNLLTDALGKNQAFSIISRHDLLEFLTLNNLQQNDNLSDIVSVGGRLGLNFVVTGRIEKKGVILAIEFIVASVRDEKVIFTRKVQVAGDSNLATEVIKISDSISAAIITSAH
jgi:membrane-associated protease RseP (regulator of RpoE activity)